jgi:hypothetical protein
MANSNNDALRELQAQFEAMANPETQKAFFEGCVKECAARFLGKVIRKTPVGENLYAQQETGETYKSGKKKGKAKTKKVVARQGGTLRRGWTAKTEAEAESGGGSSNPMQHAETLNVDHSGTTHSITIINPVHYASFVENGHRQQPGRFVPAIGKRLKKGWVEGQFMMAKSEEEIKAEIPAVLQRRLDNFLKGGGTR